MYDQEDQNRQELVPKLRNHADSEKQNYQPNVLKWIHLAKINNVSYNAISITIETK